MVRNIFNDYLKGHSTMRIARHLNTIGTSGRDYWNEKAVMYILENPLYVGTLRWRKETEHYFEVEDSVPPIIEQETFKQTQLLREARKTLTPAPIWELYFSGIIKCPCCGKSLVGNYVVSKTKYGAKTKYKYYFCRGRKLGVCNMGNISERKLEQIIIPQILSFYVYPTDDIVQTEDPSKDEIAKIKSTLKLIEKRRKSGNMLGLTICLEMKSSQS